jgi:threonine/homoserine/homoserine lactone efflux protein
MSLEVGQVFVLGYFVGGLYMAFICWRIARKREKGEE